MKARSACKDVQLVALNRQRFVCAHVGIASKVRQQVEAEQVVSCCRFSTSLVSLHVWSTPAPKMQVVRVA